MPRENLIGEYLRARRELVRPEDIGVHDLGGRRRVAGLRRSEVALLAGMSTDYYVRLEQGRDQHPSPQVLDALGRGRCNSTNTPPRTCTASPTRQQRGAARDRGPRRLLRASCS